MSFELSLEEGKFLVELARKAVEEYLKSKKKISASENIPEKLLQLCGVFVTINTIRDGEKELEDASVIHIQPLRWFRQSSNLL